MKIKDKYTFARLVALWEFIWLLGSLIGYGNTEYPWLFPLSASLVGAPIVAGIIFAVSVKLSEIANKNRGKEE